MAWEVIHKVALTETHWTVEDLENDLMHMDYTGTRPVRFTSYATARAWTKRLNQQRGINT